jgi:two-component system response regulator FlrC
MTALPVLIVEDDAHLREALSDALEFAGCPSSAVADADSAMRKLDEARFGLVLSDVRMAPVGGHELLKRIRTRFADLPVVLMTAYGTVEKAVEAMRDGASDYLIKPFETDALIKTVSKWRRADEPDEGPVAEDPRMRAVMDLARRVAASEATVMISGESGAGKEVIARFVHERSARASGPFVAINCAAIPENMLEAVLFGHEKGAFTGAHAARPGKFEHAQGGTLLLDEISEMPLGLQAKLLRVLQEREVERIGARSPVALDVRVLATTNRALREEVAAGRFREDLFYRLNVLPLRLPPLRERPDDILPLARRFMARAPVGAAALSPEAAKRLCEYRWPGNVRELDNVIQRALILRTGARVEAADLRFETEAEALAEAAAGLDDDMKTHEKRLILDALRTERSRKAAADRLGISPRTLRYKLARLREAGVDLQRTGTEFA